MPFQSVCPTLASIIRYVMLDTWYTTVVAMQGGFKESWKLSCNPYKCIYSIAVNQNFFYKCMHINNASTNNLLGSGLIRRQTLIFFHLVRIGRNLNILREMEHARNYSIIIKYKSIRSMRHMLYINLNIQKSYFVFATEIHDIPSRSWRVLETVRAPELVHSRRGKYILFPWFRSFHSNWPGSKILVVIGPW